MSETEEIRAELTRLGVDWTNRDSLNDYKTVWHHGHTSYLFIESIFDSDMTILKVRKPTPEQAIASTLGSGTCHNVWDIELTGRLRFQCSECGGVSLEIKPNFCPVCGRKVVKPATNDVDMKED